MCGCEPGGCPCDQGMHGECGCHKQDMAKEVIDSTRQLAPATQYVTMPNEDTGNNKAYGRLLSKRILC